MNPLLNLQNIENRGGAFVGDQEKTDQQITNTLNYNKQINSSLNLNAVVATNT